MIAFRLPVRLIWKAPVSSAGPDSGSVALASVAVTVTTFAAPSACVIAARSSDPLSPLLCEFFGSKPSVISSQSFTPSPSLSMSCTATR